MRQLQRRVWERVGREKLLLRCRLLGRVRRFGAHEGRRGAGEYRGGRPPRACYPRRARSALGVDTVLTLDVCLYVCMLVL